MAKLNDRGILIQFPFDETSLRMVDNQILPSLEIKATFLSKEEKEAIIMLKIMYVTPPERLQAFFPFDFSKSNNPSPDYIKKEKDENSDLIMGSFSASEYLQRNCLSKYIWLLSGTIAAREDWLITIAYFVPTQEAAYSLIKPVVYPNLN